MTYYIKVGVDPRTGKYKQKSKGGFKTKKQHKLRLLKWSVHSRLKVTGTLHLRNFFMGGGKFTSYN
ncbi:Arm DNA-binding domain-containing protein [Salicibibacter cibarius]|uniref:Arm DNA-binding domain-containing protein n=1 Tax=Salicibibacter cibarius TaxID=2743000 RepID=UPI003CCDBD2B